MTERRDNPLAKLPPLRALKILSEVTIATLGDHYPRFHLSLVNGTFLEAQATTILVTGADASGDEVLAVPFSSDETFERGPVRRLLKARVALKQDRWADPRLAYFGAILPAPQAVVSVVSQMAIENPGSHIGASGGDSPLLIIAGACSLQFGWSHGVYNAAEAAMFYRSFFPRLAGRL